MTHAYAGRSPIAAKITNISLSSSQTSEKHKLANTGYPVLVAGTFAILLVLFGAGIYSVSRKDN